MSRQARITDAAILTLARAGMRGLTHRAVDRAAGLPEGSTSYYYRSRRHLLEATAARLLELDEAEMPALAAPDVDHLAVAAARLVHRWATIERDRQLARYELTLEATRRPELRAALSRGGARMRSVVAELLAHAGVAAPQRRAGQLVAVIEGLVFDQVAGAGHHRTDSDGLDGADPSGADLGPDQILGVIRRVIVALTVDRQCP